MQFIDTHIHLQDFSPSFALQVLADTRVKKLISVSASPDDWPKLVALMKAYPQKIISAFGIHPWYAKKNAPLEELESLLVSFPSSLIGEVGVDALKSPVTALEQDLFAAELKLAKKHSRPVLVHAAKAFDALQTHLHALKEVKYVYHGFAANAEIIKFVNKSGGYIGLSALFLRGKKAREYMRLLDKNKILFETDAPFRVNEENYLKNAENNLLKLSEIADMPIDELTEQLNANAEEFIKC